MTPKETLPRWDVSVVFPSLESPEFDAGMQAATQAIDDLVTLFDDHRIELKDSVSLDTATVASFETVIKRYNQVLDQTHVLSAYISSFVTTDTRNALAQAKRSELQQQIVKLSLLDTRFTAWIGLLDAEELIGLSTPAQDHAFMLRKAKKQALHLMTPAEEALAAELELSGGSAWAKLHSDVTSQLAVTVELEDGPQEMPMSAVRNLAHSPDRAVRQSGYEAEVAAWEAAEVPLAAALNSIKGQVNTLSERRGWDSALDAALFSNNMGRDSLDAMMQAVQEAYPDFRHYLKIKAQALGLPVLAWYDLFAPLGASSGSWSYSDATAFIAQHFGSFSPKLADLANRASAEDWIDAEPRAGKVDGAFCMRLRAEESRILSNFKPSYSGMSTLAHELGHAYHNLNLADRTILQRQTPMTLAETASIFCETIVREAALELAGTQEQISILEASLQGGCQLVLDLPSRFLFEQAIFDKRRARELSPAEFKELLLEAQAATYGDGLDSETYHGHMWAMKPHYYSTGRSFYNYPYTFGWLFGLGLYARFKDDPETFKANYDELLSSTGMDNAAELAARFGIDIRSVAFWRSSLDLVRADIERFEDLITRHPL